MRIVAKDLGVDESRSNHACEALCYSKCPDNRVCFYFATGFGGAITNICPFFKEIPKNEEEAECTFDQKEV